MKKLAGGLAALGGIIALTNSIGAALIIVGLAAIAAIVIRYCL